jgi:hypothetical protein
MRTKVGERMRADEREFADQPRLVSSGCEEILLAGAPRGEDESGLRKLALFLRTGLDAAGLERALRAATETLPVAPLRVTLDRVFGGWPAPAPCDAILWMHGVAEPVDVALPSEVALVGRVVTDTAETAAADLAVAGCGTLE